MATFVHLTAEKNSRSIARSGIRCRRSAAPEGRVVFALPVTRNYYVSHQWARELRRSGQRTIVAVHFRIPDHDRVLIGRYGARHVTATAAGAVKIVMQSGNAEGFEVLVPRRIEPNEIRAIRPVHRVTGWRYSPEAHGGPPFCGCSYCQRGRIKSRRIRERYEATSNTRESA
jgi:hypothetical protein